MSQHDMVVDNGPGLAVRTDINAAIQALLSMSSGPIEPATMYAGMLWLDTSVSPAVIRQRSQGNTAWGGMTLQDGKIKGAAFQLVSESTTGGHYIQFVDSAGIVRGTVFVNRDTNTLSLQSHSAAGAIQQRLDVNSSGAALTTGAAAGDVLTTGNVATNAVNTTTIFQIGTTVMVNKAVAAVARGAAVVVRLDAASAELFTTTVSGNPSVLAGNWQCRGSNVAGGTVINAQRIS